MNMEVVYQICVRTSNFGAEVGRSYSYDLLSLGCETENLFKIKFK